MPSYSVSASEIKYASGSSWTSGKARQGVYSSTRYEGALNFAGLANFSFSNIAVTGIQMRVTFGPTGGSSAKYLTLYGGAKNSISGSIGFDARQRARARYPCPTPSIGRSTLSVQRFRQP